MANDAQQGKVLGEYAVKKLSAKKVAIIDDRTAYGQGLADEFEKAAKLPVAKWLAVNSPPTRKPTSTRS